MVASPLQEVFSSPMLEGLQEDRNPRRFSGLRSIESAVFSVSNELQLHVASDRLKSGSQAVVLALTSVLADGRGVDLRIPLQESFSRRGEGPAIRCRKEIRR